MLNFKGLMFATSAFAVLSAPAIASGISASTVTSTGASCMVEASNTTTTDICNALGVADSTSTTGSAEIGDGLLFDFDGPGFDTATLFFADAPTVDFALSFLGGTGPATAGVLGSTAEMIGSRYQIEVKVAGLFNSLQVSQVGPTTSSALIDAVSVKISSIPAPASAALLLVGVGALGLARRRKS